jgi:hypothetical protein
MAKKPYCPHRVHTIKIQCTNPITWNRIELYKDDWKWARTWGKIQGRKVWSFHSFVDGCSAGPGRGFICDGE